MIVSNEVSDLDGILVMQNKLRVSYCNYSFVGEQGHPRAVGQYDVPSNPAASMVLVHSGTQIPPVRWQSAGQQELRQ